MIYNYELTDLDIKVIKSALMAHLKQCKKFLNEDHTKTFTEAQIDWVIQKVKTMEELLYTM